VAKIFADLTPLKVSAPFRRIWFAHGASNIGQQMASVAVGLQIWELTNSSLMVGLVGLAQLIPLIGFGLYGGSLSDTFDRRTVGLVTAIGMWVTSLFLFAQAFLSFDSVGFLYLVVAIQSAFFAVGNPARQAIIPRIVPVELLPAANALGIITWNLGFTLGPLIGGFLIAATGAITAPYLLDVVAFGAVIYAMYRLPKLPPTQSADASRGWKSVKEGFEFLRGKINLQMSFYQDLVAMVFGMPRALFPAIAALWFGGTTQDIAFTLGMLAAAPALGGLISGILSGPLGRVRWQGRAIVISVIAWGVSITAFGFSRTLIISLVLLAIAGAADNISAIFRMTILQSATPDEYRGRLQGVHTVVVAGGPRLGDVESGVVASLGGEAFSVISGGLVCVGLSIGLAAKFRGFLRYDAEHPVP
jgi:MFS family permease